MIQHKGITLVEMIIVLAIVAVLSTTVAPAFREMMIRQTLISSSNQAIMMLYSARVHAMEHGSVLICDKSTMCSQFHQADTIVIVAANQVDNASGGPSEILHTWHLPKGMTMDWRSFRNRPWLEYRADATSYFQNGSLLLCYHGQARRVIITRIGRPRIDPDLKQSTHCSI